MDKQMYRIKIGDSVKEYPQGTTYLELAKEHQSEYEADIVLAMIENRLEELGKPIRSDCEVSFVTTASTVGNKTYRRSMKLLFVKAVHDVGGHDVIKKVHVGYSVSKGYYCTIEGEITLDEEFLAKVDARMKQMSEERLPIQKRSISTDDAIKLFARYGMHDKEKLFRYRRSSIVNIYSLNEFEDYYYGYMVPDTSYLKYFKLYLYEGGVVLQMPVKGAPTVVPEFKPQHKLFKVLQESVEWGNMLEAGTVGELNEAVTKQDVSELILVQEALQEKKIAEIAQQIAEQPDVKFVLIAGPSSSGKTTFSHRLSVQLRANGLKPHPIAVDNYFKNRVDTPKDASGEYDFECLEAIDLELFNQDMCSLLAGEEIMLPTYNFKTGEREYRGDKKKLGEQDILVIEGIHGLNDKMSHALPTENKFKIYISALTQINIDEHNQIPTTDGRLIRRIVRDARTRGTSAKRTIELWPSVRRGEEANIFPFQEQADVMFNSALIYELAVLKQYAEPALFEIESDCEEYTEAKRLLKFFDYFVGIGGENIPANSILREFIGGGCFRI